MKNNVELIGGVFSNIGKDWVNVLFNLQYNFNLKDTKDIISYLNNTNIFYKDWELENIGHEYNAILLKCKDGFKNTKYLKMEATNEK